MKHFKFLTPVAIGVSTLLFSCNSADEKKADEPAKDTAAAPAPAPEPAKPANLMTVIAKVSNFAKWLPTYESGDSIRASYGLHNFSVARGADDTNMVMVVMTMDDPAKAKEYANSPLIKERMKKGGVSNATINFLDMQMLDQTPSTSMRVLIKHKVKDWDAFKKVYDSHKQMRMDAGLTDRALGYEVGDNHMASIVLLVADRKKADEFSKSENLKKKMEEAGVDGPPTFFYYNQFKKY
jgi:uncharacterized protein YeaO (DUF488 family)